MAPSLLERIGDTGLPVAASLTKLAAERVVLSAPPGTGKTTLVPPWLADETSGRIIVVEPRRLAARAAARRLAHLLGEPVGQTAGFTVRGERKVSSSTRIEFVTGGVMLRRLLADPDLPGVSGVILDEVHERHLDIDLATAFLLDIADLTGLRLIAMSATIAANQWAQLLDGTVVEATGTSHPVDLSLHPGPAPLTERGVSRDFLAHIASLARKAAVASGGDVLVFLPGRWEIDRVAEQLPGAIPLHGSVPPHIQDQILAGSDSQRIILATSIAESSLTVPGVRAVVDSGLAREPRMDVRRGIGSLVTVMESKDRAAQRAGRAGREAPGIAYLAMSQVSHARLDAHTLPELATADLAPFVLMASCWGHIEDLRLLDAPPAASLERARELLDNLGVLDHGEVTALGRKIATAPAHPRIARALIERAGEVGGRQAAEICALLEEDVRAPGADLAPAWRQIRREKPRTWVQSADRLQRLTGTKAKNTRGRVGTDEALALIVASAYPDRISALRSGTYLTAGGGGAALPKGSPLIGQELLAVGDMTGVGKADAIIRQAVPITLEDAERCGHVTTRTVHNISGDRVRAWAVRSLGAIELSRSETEPEPEAAMRLLTDYVRAGRLGGWSKEAEDLLGRLRFLDKVEGWETSGALTPEELAPEMMEWARGKPIRADLVQVLRRRLDWRQLPDLDRLAPTRINSPAGGTAKVHYDAERPYARLKLQECFGMTSSPVLGGGVRLQLHLLSPAGRPLAVTDDLASFWSGAYGEVRGEMRGRYPKHPWPEDPLTAPPTRRTKRRS
ncbi:MAG: ATP-dependent helicase HrpB [Flaviflexus sp.]|nr:ATP-dependent helicase HrpB [Flaviflexus sp.]